MDQQIKQQAHQNNPIKMQGNDQESEWSLSSIEELKGLNLNQMKQQEDRQQQIRNSQDNPKSKQKSKLQPKFPPLQQITPNSKMFEVGKIIQRVGELLIIEANNCNNLADFDNWLFDDKRQILGFVIDIFGKVDHPYYALQLLDPIQLALKQDNIGNIVFYAQGCKTLTQQDIKSIRDKSSQQKQADNDISSSQSQRQDSSQNIKSNFVMRKRQYPPKRKTSFEEEPYHRQRTRQKKYHQNRNQMYNRNQRNNFDPRNDYQNRNQARDRQHNQLYLQNMYNAYYTQMMQLYNGQNGMPLPKPPIFPMYQMPHQQHPQPPQPPQPPQ